MNQAQGNTTQLQALLDQAAGGDTTAYDEIINLAATRLQKLTGKMLAGYPHLRRWEDTSDVFQTAVIRLHRSLSEVQPDSVKGLIGLAATQIRRTLIDLARHHFGPQGEAAHHHSDAGVSNGAGIIDRHSTSDSQPGSLQSWVEFHEAVEQLAEDDRQVFELVWYGGLQQQEIAGFLGVSVPTVKRRFRSARIQLHESLQGSSPLDSQG